MVTAAQRHIYSVQAEAICKRMPGFETIRARSEAKGFVMSELLSQSPTEISGQVILAASIEVCWSGTLNVRVPRWITSSVPFQGVLCPTYQANGLDMVTAYGGGEFANCSHFMKRTQQSGMVRCATRELWVTSVRETQTGLRWVTVFENLIWLFKSIWLVVTWRDTFSVGTAPKHFGNVLKRTEMLDVSMNGDYKLQFLSSSFSCRTDLASERLSTLSFFFYSIH